MSFTMRTTKPEAGNKYYIRKAEGGYSNAIKGKPTDNDCNVLSNCVGYAYGRFNEIGNYGYCKYLAPVNAENFMNYKGSCQTGSTPKVGACMVWGGKGNLAGHVAIVEKVISNNEVYTSESGWGSKRPFWNQTRKNDNGRWGMGSNYPFIGFIYNSAVPEEVDPEPIPTPKPTTLKYKIGDKVKFSGTLYKDSYGNGAGQYRKDLEATIYLVNSKGSCPYNINNGLGWVKESDLSSNESPTPEVKIYIVKSGDNLSQIARRFNTTWEKIYNDNKSVIGNNPNLIRPGQKLVIK